MINELIIKTMPLIPKSVVKRVAKKYIAGSSLDDAVRVAKEIMAKGGKTTIDALGEFVETKEMAIKEKETCLKIVEAIRAHKLDSTISLKPTSLGLGIDFEFARENISEIVKKADENGIYARLDMENSPYTDLTLDMYRKLREDGLENVGIVLQAYLRRTENDVKSLVDYKPTIRLCKGIYKEPPEIAIQSKEGVRENYKKLLRLIVENGMFVGIATHDEILIQDALSYIKEKKLTDKDYEFQALLGVRVKREFSLIEEGHNLRIYVPFGEDWYGYATRRLKENPDMAGAIAKAIFFKG